MAEVMYNVMDGWSWKILEDVSHHCILMKSLFLYPVQCCFQYFIYLLVSPGLYPLFFSYTGSKLNFHILLLSIQGQTKHFRSVYMGSSHYFVRVTLRDICNLRGQVVILWGSFYGVICYLPWWSYGPLQILGFRLYGVMWNFGPGEIPLPGPVFP